jgi:hypothetical protein
MPSSSIHVVQQFFRHDVVKRRVQAELKLEILGCLTLFNPNLVELDYPHIRVSSGCSWAEQTVVRKLPSSLGKGQSSDADRCAKPSFRDATDHCVKLQ